MIHSLDGPNGPTYDIKEMIDVASNFYRDLYKKEDRKGFSLSDDFFSEGEKVTGNDNISLESPFTEDEVNNPVFGSYSNGVPGPDGLSFLFYQYFWQVIKDDLMALFHDFHAGGLDIYRLNFAVLSFIP